MPIRRHRRLEGGGWSSAAGPMATAAGWLRGARRLLPVGVRRESRELARLAGPVVRDGA